MTLPTNGLVSIITPAFNAARFISDTIESARAQTYTDWEMLVVDDCSSDQTAVIVNQCAKQDERIYLLQHEHNLGPANARNTALSKTRGRYIAFLDSDDLWLPEKLERQFHFMHEKNAAISFTQFRRISADGSRCGGLIRVPPRITYYQLLKNTAIATSTVMIDRDKTGPFAMKKTYYDDYALWLELLKHGFIAYGLQEDLMRYRVVTRSVSRRKVNSAIWVWRTYRNIEKLSIPYAAWCFANYAVRGLLKYRHF